MTTNYFYQIIICCVFLIILWGISFILKRKQNLFLMPNDQKRMQILEKKMIDRRQSILLMKVDNEEILIGLGPSGITKIHEIKANE